MLHMRVSFTCLCASRLIDFVAPSAIFIAGMLHSIRYGYTLSLRTVIGTGILGWILNIVLVLCSGQMWADLLASLFHINQIYIARTCQAYLDQHFCRCAYFGCVMIELNLVDHGLAHGCTCSTFLMGKHGRVPRPCL